MRSVLSRDATRIVSLGPDNEARIFSSSGRLLANLIGHTGKVRSAVFSADSKHVLTASEDKTVRLWTVGGKHVRTFTGEQFGVFAVAMSADGRHVAAGGKAGTISLWDASGKLIRTYSGQHKVVQSLAFTPDGSTIVAGYADAHPLFWPTDGATPVAVTGHTKAVTSVAVSPDPTGSMVLTGSEDGTARLWSRSGALLSSFENPVDGRRAVLSVAFLPDGRSILMADAAGAWRFKLDPILFLPADQQTAMACERLKTIGISSFSPDARKRYRILDGIPDDPCGQTARTAPSPSLAP